jgi:hypothetical protein
MRRIAALAGLLLLAGALRAQEAPVGEPLPDAPVRDVEFGVTVRQFGLERHVEMLQWQSTPNGFERVWSDEPIDASRFDPAHANPVGWPLPGRRWLARSATLDGKPLAPDVIATLGEWRDFRPGFNALPGNMAATFQPEGDGLGSADNPLAPEVGDLRIRWRQLVLPPLQGRVRLEDGRWRLASPDGTNPNAAAAVTASSVVATPPPAEVRPGDGVGVRWWLGGVLLVLAAVVIALHRQRVRRGRN